MKKSIVAALVPLLLLCGCSSATENSSTRFMLDTVISVRAAASAEVINGAFSVCSEYEKLLSKTAQGSDVYNINQLGVFEVSSQTAQLISNAKFYYELTNGRFDISVGAVSGLWDFENGVKPDDAAVTAALKNVGYNNICITGNTVDSGGTSIDLGAIAKGYIADKMREYFEAQGVKEAVLNLGGNVVLMGREKSVSVQDPFGQGEKATILLKDTSVATAGTYERCFTENGVNYHHILDTKTGYPAQSDVVSATVITKSAEKADALSTCIVLMGCKSGIDIINGLQGVEALVITADGSVHVSDGLYCENGVYRL